MASILSLNKTLVMMCLMLAVFLVQASQASSDQPKLCPVEMKLSGACSTTWDCFMALNGKYGASAMIQHCQCFNARASHVCKCLGVCDFVGRV
ncbi:hypothetical protein QQ045_003423 [Rhodiola kirilowii]